PMKNNLTSRSVMKKNQSGFAAIEAVLILVIVGIIGGTGYFVWHAKQNADKSLDAANESAQGVAESTAAKANSNATSLKAGDSCVLEDGSKGSVVSLGDKYFTFCEPNGWKLFYTEVPGAF